MDDLFGDLLGGNWGSGNNLHPSSLLNDASINITAAQIQQMWNTRLAQVVPSTQVSTVCDFRTTEVLPVYEFKKENSKNRFDQIQSWMRVVNFRTVGTR